MAEPTPLTPHFTLEELTVSDTAVKKGISNLPDDRQRANLVALCQNVLEPLRAALGHPLNVNSGFRSQALNEAIPGSAKKSQHLEGQAADIVCSAMSPLDLFKRIIELGLPYDQLIYERKSPTSVWVHVSHDTAGQRGELLRAVFPPGGGATTYVPLTRSQALALTEPASRGLMLGPPVNTYEEAHDEPDEVVPARKAPAKKAPAKKAPAKKAVAKKAPAKKAVAKKAVAKKAPAKKAVAKKAPAKKVVVKQAVAKRSTTKKVAAKKAPAKKVVAKKAPAKKAAKKAAPVRRKR